MKRRMFVITISNIRQNSRGEYIGRENKTYGVKESPLANPYPLKRESERDGVIESYAKWMNLNLSDPFSNPVKEEIERLKVIYREKGELNLVCWCFPRRCHGEVIREVIEREFVTKL
jgi:hypothetical protein